MAAGLMLGALPAAAQQTGTASDTTRAASDTGRARTGVTSTRRIPVRKDAGITTTTTTTTSTGTVGADTTTMADTTRMDTTRMDTTRMDTTRMDTTRVDTTRVDTSMTTTTTTVPTTDTVVSTTTTATTTTTTSDAMLRRGMFGNGFYIGIGGGATMPQGDFGDVYGTSFNVTVPIGWQSMSTPWGVRLDLGYNQVNGKTFDTGTGEVELDDGTIWSALLGLTAQWPVGASGTSFYLVGGGGVHHFRDFGGFSDDGGGTTGGGLFGGDEENVTKFGLNGGAGINFGIGAADLFLEARYVSVFTENENTNYIPIVIGLRFF
jgi:hypothetical protein